MENKNIYHTINITFIFLCNSKINNLKNLNFPLNVYNNILKIVYLFSIYNHIQFLNF